MIVALYLGNMKMFLLLSLISIMCSCVHKNTDEEVWKDLLGKTTIANTNKDKYKDSFLVDSLGKTIYPDYYAGSYVNSACELVIGVVGDTSVYRDEIRKMLGNDLFLITEREYPYNHLLSKYDSLIMVLEAFIEQRDTGKSASLNRISGMSAIWLKKRCTCTESISINSTIIRFSSSDI